MAKAELSTLPTELREEIWRLALLPDPGVYQFDPDRFAPLEDLDGFEDERWMIPKGKYPTAMHLCRESRRFAQDIMEREQRQEQDGSLPYYCLGCSTRPFNPETDTFWFDRESRLKHPWVLNLESVIGNRIHTIKNLALSSECIRSETPGTNMISYWDSFRWGRLWRFVSLKRVDIILGATWAGRDSGCKSSESYIDLDQVLEFRLEKWTAGSSPTKTLDEVEAKIDKVQASIVEVFQYMFERMQENEDEEPPLPKEAPGWQDGSKITFHAAQIVKVRIF
jgi:hypothetical protein